MIFGIHAIVEAIEANKEIDKIMIKKDLDSSLSQVLFEALRNHPLIQLQRVPLERLNHYTLKNHEGAIAFISKIEYQKISNIIPSLFEQGKDPFVVLVDGVTDVRNFGSLARTCSCAGVDAIVVPIRGGIMVNADAIKTSAGSLHSLPICKERSLVEAIRFLKNSGIKVMAVVKGAKMSYAKTDFSGPLAVLFLDEHAESSVLLQEVNEVIGIPTVGPFSLNVSVSAGVVLFEALKQRI